MSHSHNLMSHPPKLKKFRKSWDKCRRHSVAEACRSFLASVEDWKMFAFYVLITDAKLTCNFNKTAENGEIIDTSCGNVRNNIIEMNTEVRFHARKFLNMKGNAKVTSIIKRLKREKMREKIMHNFDNKSMSKSIESKELKQYKINRN